MVNEHFTDLMIDIETGGLRPDKHHMIQLSVVPFTFNATAFATREHCFDGCMFPVPWREWMMETHSWWNNKHVEVFRTICARMRPAADVMRELQQYLQYFENVPRIWGLRAFDWQFIESYFHDFGLKNPIKYHKFREVATAVDMLTLGKVEDFNKLRPAKVDGQAHDSLNDCIAQIQWLMKGKQIHDDATQNR